MRLFAAARATAVRSLAAAVCALRGSLLRDDTYCLLHLPRLQGFQHNNPPKGGGGVGALPLAEKLMPQYMKEAGYSTYHVGKWHLGLHKTAYLPQNRGFDYSFGYYSGAMDYYAHNAQGAGHLDLHRAYANEEQQCQPMYNGTYDLGVLITEANSVLDQHSPEDNNLGKGTQPHIDTPLFMYLALHSVHEPNQVGEEWMRPFAAVQNGAAAPRRTMCGMIAALDDGIGNLHSHWKHAKGEAFWNNTVLFFHSDNGGPTYPGAANKNLPLRGGKLTLFDGGMRVNAFAYSAGLLSNANGRNETGMLHITDLLPTFVHLAGGALTGSNGALDGSNVWDTILSGAISPRTEILHLIDPLGNAASPNPAGCALSGLAGACANSSAIRKGNYKLIVGMYAACAKDDGASDPRACGWFNPDLPPPPPPPIPAACEAVMAKDCGSLKRNGTQCLACMTAHTKDLQAADCSAADAEAFCAGPDREHDPYDTTYRTGDAYENTMESLLSYDERSITYLTSANHAAAAFDPADPPMVLFDISKDPYGKRNESQ